MWLLLTLAAGLASAYDLKLYQASLPSLKGQAARLQRSLEQVERDQLYAFEPDMCECRSPGAARSRVEVLGDWVQQHCGGFGAQSQCIAQLRQDVKRMAPYHETVELSGEHFAEQTLRFLQRQASGFLEEQQDVLGAVRRVVRALEDPSEAHGVNEQEMMDRIQEASLFEASPDRSMALRVGMRADGASDAELDAERSCTCFRVTQARTFWGGAEDAIPGSRGQLRRPMQDFILPDATWQTSFRSRLRARGAQASGQVATRMLADSEEQREADETEGELDEHARFIEFVDQAARKYARENSGLTTLFMILFPWIGPEMECSYDSGPLFPPFTIHCLGCHWAPCFNVYDQGYVFIWASLGMFYFQSCPYGPIWTSCPQYLEYSYINPCGRQWPERTSCGSHPSGCSQSDNGANNEVFEMWDHRNDPAGAPGNAAASRRLLGAAHNEALYGTAGAAYEKNGGFVFVAPQSNVYDARLVEALYTFADQGALVQSATLFTSTLSQLEALGLHPKESMLQHMGVTLEFSQPVWIGERKWRFLTLEMVANGLMWILSSDAAPEMGYTLQQTSAMTFDGLSPKIVARYVASQQGRTYHVGKVNCQTIALELTQRLSLHGRSLQSLDQAETDFFHGPTRVEFSNLHASFFDWKFPIALAVVTAILVVLAVLLKMAHRRYVSKFGPVPLTPIFLLFSLQTGSVLLPLLVGGYWTRQWKQAQKLNLITIDEAKENELAPVE